MSQVTSAVSRPHHDVLVEPHVKVRMRDGVRLDATIWRPLEPGRYPVILERMGYEVTARCATSAEYYARRGYVFVGQNTRGSHDSGGVYSWYASDGWGERQDGCDSVEWAGTQAWSTGLVGMIDGSYSGVTQYLVAPTRPPHLAALCVRQAAPPSHGAVFRGGVFPLVWLGVVTRHVLEDLGGQNATSPAQLEIRAKLQQAVTEQASWERHLPLKDIAPLKGVAAGQLYFDFLDHPDNTSWWWQRDIRRRYAEVDVPILHIAGWFDVFLGPQLDYFQGVRAQGRTPRCRRAQRLVIGPWIHGAAAVGKRDAGELDFGPEAELDLAAFRLPWFDHWLKGVDSGVLDGPPVRVFLMGENRWIEFNSWPPEEITYTPLYFHEGTRRSEASLNGGAATFDPPAWTQKPDAFSYDPEQPVLSLGHFPDYGPRDYQALEKNMVTYTSAPLEMQLVVIGPVRAILYASSSAPDTDWVVRLCDVHPDGRSMSVCDGILRGRYRDSTERPELMDPSHVYRFEVDLWATAQSFARGHRLRVEVTSSDFPRYDRNLNTGGPFGEEISGRVAVNCIYHDPGHPSHMLLPILLPEHTTDRAPAAPVRLSRPPRP